MHAHIFQHVPFEGTGSICTWLNSQNAKISTTYFYKDEFPPDIDDVDFLIVMGGPMSVHASDIYPWLELEKAFICAAIHAGKPVLGICLGAQLIAAAMGSAIKSNPVKEIGWFPIHGSAQGDGFRFPEEITVFHWHGETFDLPPDTIRLASSADCKNQAFQLQDRKVIGLQFHLETIPESCTSLIENCREELVEGPKIMREEEMKVLAPQQCPQINGLMDQLLEFLTA